MSGLWSRYLGLLDRRPVLTKAVTSASLYVVGDLLAQKLDGTLDRSGYDPVRGRTALVWGGVIFAPTAHVWYNRMLNPLFPGSGAKAVAAKMVLDQTVFALPANGAYLVCSNLLSGKSMEQSQAVLTQQIRPVMMANWAVWPFLQVLNFALVPPPLQVPFINVCILGWSAFLALKANEGEAAAGGATATAAAADKDADVGKEGRTAAVAVSGK
jgi:protein Mpv17